MNSSFNKSIFTFLFIILVTFTYNFLLLKQAWAFKTKYGEFAIDKASDNELIYAIKYRDNNDDGKFDKMRIWQKDMTMGTETLAYGPKDFCQKRNETVPGDTCSTDLPCTGYEIESLSVDGPNLVMLELFNTGQCTVNIVRGSTESRYTTATVTVVRHVDVSTGIVREIPGISGEYFNVQVKNNRVCYSYYEVPGQPDDHKVDCYNAVNLQSIASLPMLEGSKFNLGGRRLFYEYKMPDNNYLKTYDFPTSTTVEIVQNEAATPYGIDNAVALYGIYETLYTYSIGQHAILNTVLLTSFPYNVALYFKAGLTRIFYRVLNANNWELSYWQQGAFTNVVSKSTAAIDPDLLDATDDFFYWAEFVPDSNPKVGNIFRYNINSQIIEQIF